MRDKERLEEKTKYMKTHKYAIIALVILLDVIIRIKANIRKIFTKPSGG